MELYMLIDILALPIYYINLDTDIQRHQNIRQLFKKCGMTNTFRVSGKLPANKLNRTGCALSHKYVYEKIMSMPQDSLCIVFEDDVALTEHYIQYVDIPSNFDCVFLGISDYRQSVSHMQEYKNLVKVNHMHSGHALLLRNNHFIYDAYNIILQSIKNETFHDEDMCKLFCRYNIYALKRPLFFQTSSAAVTDVVIE